MHLVEVTQILHEDLCLAGRRGTVRVKILPEALAVEVVDGQRAGGRDQRGRHFVGAVALALDRDAALAGQDDGRHLAAGGVLELDQHLLTRENIAVAVREVAVTQEGGDRLHLLDGGQHGLGLVDIDCHGDSSLHLHGMLNENAAVAQRLHVVVGQLVTVCDDQQHFVEQPVR